MMNNNLINESIKLVENYFEGNHITVDSDIIRKRVENWYCNSDIADAEVLAAVAIESDYEPMNYDEILAKRDYYFPEVPMDVHNIHIGEIEMALNDMRWQ